MKVRGCDGRVEGERSDRPGEFDGAAHLGERARADLERLAEGAPLDRVDGDLALYHVLAEAGRRHEADHRRRQAQRRARVEPAGSRDRDPAAAVRAAVVARPDDRSIDHEARPGAVDRAEGESGDRGREGVDLQGEIELPGVQLDQRAVAPGRVELDVEAEFERLAHVRRGGSSSQRAVTPCCAPAVEHGWSAARRRAAGRGIVRRAISEVS